MTSAEVGVILKVSPRTVQRMTQSGKLPCLRKLPGPIGDYLYAPAVVREVAEARGIRFEGAVPGP